jgi:hypothetical protein
MYSPHLHDSAVLLTSMTLLHSLPPWLCCTPYLHAYAVLLTSMALLYSLPPWLCCSLYLHGSAVLLTSKALLCSLPPWLCCTPYLHGSAVLLTSMALLYSLPPWLWCTPYLHGSAVLFARGCVYSHVFLSLKILHNVVIPNFFLLSYCQVVFNSPAVAKLILFSCLFSPFFPELETWLVVFPLAVFSQINCIKPTKLYMPSLWM